MKLALKHVLAVILLVLGLAAPVAAGPIEDALARPIRQGSAIFEA
jgi:hypothetical protein